MNHDELPGNSSHLFREAGFDPRTLPIEEVLAREAPKLRSIVSRWWRDLEPETKAGVPSDKLEEALSAFAEKALGARRHQIDIAWARSWFSWKPGFAQSPEDQVIGRRFVAAMERLGVLTVQRGKVAFCHQSLREFYFGLSLSARLWFPKKLQEHSRTSAKPLDDPFGRAVLVRLATTDRDKLPKVLSDVADANLLLATWFLYANRDLHREHGEWLAGRVLEAVEWGDSSEVQTVLLGCLGSLLPESLSVARRLLGERVAPLPSFRLAVEHLAAHGSSDDVSALAEIVELAALGEWEIEQLRSTLVSAQGEVENGENRKRYARGHVVEGGKFATALTLKLVGVYLSKTASPRNSSGYFEGPLLEKTADKLAALPGTSFYEQQRLLRQLIVELPDLIEHRKHEVVREAPAVRQQVREAIARIEARCR